MVGAAPATHVVGKGTSSVLLGSWRVLVWRIEIMEMLVGGLVSSLSGTISVLIP